MYRFLLEYSESVVFQYPILLLASFLKFRVSLVMGLCASNISIFYENFILTFSSLQIIRNK